MLKLSEISCGPSLCFALLTLSVVAGCGETAQDSSTVKPDATEIKQHVEATADEVVDSIGPARQAFLTKLKTQLKSIELKLAALSNKEKKLTEQAQVEWNNRVLQLEVRQAAARKRLKVLSEASEVGWSDLRDGAVAAWADLAKAVDAAAAE